MFLISQIERMYLGALKKPQEFKIETISQNRINLVKKLLQIY